MENRIPVMIAGLPGRMATEMLNVILGNPDFGLCLDLILASLTGPDIKEGSVDLGRAQITLLEPEDRYKLGAFFPIDRMVYAVDYTLPGAVNENAEFYCNLGMPFVMGTTGGDREKLVETVKNSDVSAVIAPNMAFPVVMVQAMVEYAAKNFPNALEGFSLKIVESHQKGKADTSGTAKAMVKSFNDLGIPFTLDQIQMIREPDFQREILGIPEEHLLGHGWHRYLLISQDKSMTLEFTHNVNGRQPYTEGTLKALAFLDKKVRAGSKGEVFK